MLEAFEIPLTSQPQRLQINLGDRPWNLGVWWNTIMEHWILDISDQDGNPVVLGIPLVTGVDLLAQHGHLGFGAKLVVQSDFAPMSPPTRDSLGTTGHCYLLMETS